MGTPACTFKQLWDNVIYTETIGYRATVLMNGEVITSESS